MHGRRLFRSLFLVCLSVLMTPALVFAGHSVSISGVPAILERNKSYTFTVTATSGTFPGATTQINLVSGTLGAMTFSPSVYTFTTTSDTRTVTLTTGSNVVGTTSVVAIHQGVFGQTTTSAPTWIQARASILAATQQMPAGSSRVIGIGLDRPAPFAVTFNFSKSGSASAGSTVPPPATLAAGVSNMAGGSITAGSQHGPFTISATLSGPGAAYYTGPDPVTVPIFRSLAFSGVNPCCIAANGTATFNAGLFGADPVGIAFDATVSLTGVSASASPSLLEFGVGEGALPFTITAGGTLGDINVKFTTPSPYVASTITHVVRVRGTMSTSNRPASVTTGQTTAPITVSLSGPAPAATTVTITPGANAPAGTTVNPSVLTIPAGETSGTFTVTAGTGLGTITVLFSLANPGTAYFTAPPASFGIPYINGAPTPVGTNVTVEPPVPPDGKVAVTSTYAEVLTEGITRLTNVANPTAPPSGYEVPGTPLYFALSTSAQTAGSITVCASYANAQTADPSELRLFRFITPSGPWIDETESIDTTNKILCGIVSGPVPAGSGVQWAIFSLNTAPVVGAITGPAGVIAAGTGATFSATFTDPDAADVHTGVWVENGESIGEATITKVDGVFTATGELTFATGGAHTIYLVIKDGGQAAFSPEFEVTVDSAPPVIQTLTASPDALWQPDSKMHDIVLTVAATDDGGVPVCAISGVTATAQNVKQTAFVVTGPLTLQLKAFPLTVYTITVTCIDAFDRTTTKTVSVAVQK